jgi:hypothetical protein
MSSGMHIGEGKISIRWGEPLAMGKYAAISR